MPEPLGGGCDVAYMKGLGTRLVSVVDVGSEVETGVCGVCCVLMVRNLRIKHSGWK